MNIRKLSLFVCTILSFISLKSHCDENELRSQDVTNTVEDFRQEKAAKVSKDSPSSLHIERKTEIDEKDKTLASESILEVLSENEANAKPKKSENSEEREKLLIDKAKARQKKAIEANKHPEKLDEDMIRLRQKANANYHRNEGNEKIAIRKAKKEALELSKRSDNNENEKSLSSSFSKISQGEEAKKTDNKKKNNAKKNTYQKKTDALINAFK